MTEGDIRLGSSPNDAKDIAGLQDGSPERPIKYLRSQYVKLFE
jgi:hypothetical protein